MKYKETTKNDMAKELVKGREYFQATTGTNSYSPLDQPAQSPNDQHRLLHEIQALHAKLEVQDVEMQNIRRELDETSKRYAAIYGLSPAITTLKDAEGICHGPVGFNNDAIFIVDAESGIIIDINKPAEKLIGRPAVDVVGMHFTKLHPEEIEHYRGLFEVHPQTKEGKVDVKVLTICHKDGRRIKVEISTSVIEFEGGKRIIQGIFKDLTDHKGLSEKYSYC